MGTFGTLDLGLGLGGVRHPDVDMWMAAEGATGAAALLDFAGQKYGFRSAAGVPRWGSVAADMTFSRASAGGRLPAAGAYEMVASGAPRFDHDPVARAPRGVLIEAAAGHISTQTANIPAWGSTNVPAGSTTDRTSYFSSGIAVEHAAPSGGYRWQTYTLPASTNHRLDAIIEAGPSAPPNFLIGLIDLATVTFAGSAYYYWATDTMAAGPGAASSSYVNEPLGTGPNGGKLVRVSCVVNSGAGGSMLLAVYPTGASGSIAGQSAILHYACCTTGTLYHSPSIIGASAQTRAAERLYFDLPFDAADEGVTIMCDVMMPHSVELSPVVLMLIRSGSLDRLGVSGVWGARFGPVGYYAGNTVWADAPAFATAVPFARQRAVVRVTPTAMSVSYLGAPVATRALAGAIPTGMTRLEIGSVIGGNYWGSTIRQVAVWKGAPFNDNRMRELSAA